jgi:hypothetical protein
MYYESQESSSTMNPKNHQPIRQMHISGCFQQQAHLLVDVNHLRCATVGFQQCVYHARAKAVFRLKIASASRSSVLSLSSFLIFTCGACHICRLRVRIGESLDSASGGSSLDHTTSFSLGILANRPCAHENRPIEIPCHQCTLLELPADHGISSPWRTDM